MTTDLEPRPFHGGSWDNVSAIALPCVGRDPWRGAPTLYYRTVGFRTLRRAREPNRRTQ